MRESDPLTPIICTLDDQDCVTCADAGIPVRVIAVEEQDALCEDAVGNRAQIAVEFVAPVTVGEILLAHGGVAIARGPADALPDRVRASAEEETA